MIKNKLDSTLQYITVHVNSDTVIDKLHNITMNKTQDPNYQSRQLSIRQIWRFTRIPIVLASLCCLGPLVLVLFGVATVSFAASLSDVLYGQYAWVFRTVGLAALLISAYLYITRQKGICTLDEAARRRNEIINILLAALSLGVIGYAVFLYGVVELVGLVVGVW